MTDIREPTPYEIGLAWGHLREIELMDCDSVLYSIDEALNFLRNLRTHVAEMHKRGQELEARLDALEND